MAIKSRKDRMRQQKVSTDAVDEEVIPPFFSTKKRTNLDRMPGTRCVASGTSKPWGDLSLPGYWVDNLWELWRETYRNWIGCKGKLQIYLLILVVFVRYLLYLLWNVVKCPFEAKTNCIACVRSDVCCSQLWWSHDLSVNKNHGCFELQREW